jgi:putative redox protein
MHSIEVQYLGELRCQGVHLKSSSTILSDAPTDNRGKGEAFSPTDLTCTSLAMCMMTLMGITADEKNIQLKNVSAQVTKLMGTEPRRIIGINIEMKGNWDRLSDRELSIIKNAANTCPVAKSIHPDIQINTNWVNNPSIT